MKNYIETLPIVNTKKEGFYLQGVEKAGIKGPKTPHFPLTTILWFVKNLSLNID